MTSGMSIASDNLRHSGSMFILLRAVQICMALLTRTESDMGVLALGWGVPEGQDERRGSVSELINTLGSLEASPA
jgi:hypothetical protein